MVCCSLSVDRKDAVARRDATLLCSNVFGNRMELRIAQIISNRAYVTQENSEGTEAIGGCKTSKYSTYYLNRPISCRLHMPEFNRDIYSPLKS
jgi:hypothetical protein